MQRAALGQHPERHIEVTTTPIDRRALNLSGDHGGLQVRVVARLQLEIEVHGVVDKPQRVVDETGVGAVEADQLADQQAHVRADVQAVAVGVAHGPLVQPHGALERIHVLVEIVGLHHLVRFSAGRRHVRELERHQVVFELDKQARDVATHVHDVGELLGVALPRAGVTMQNSMDLADVLRRTKAAARALCELAITEAEDLTATVEHRHERWVTAFLPAVDGAAGHGASCGAELRAVLRLDRPGPERR